MNKDNLKKIGRVRTVEVDNSSLIAYVMRNSGASYVDIGEVLGVSKQRAKVLADSYVGQY